MYRWRYREEHNTFSYWPVHRPFEWRILDEMLHCTYATVCVEIDLARDDFKLGYHTAYRYVFT